MKLLQNLLINVNTWVFEKDIFELEVFPYSISISMSLAKQLMSPQIMFVPSTRFTVLISWYPVCTPLILCHYH